MSHRFTLQVTRVECLNEQVLEWGKDEMRMFGFAVSRKGRFFATGYRSLGSYGEGDVRSDGNFPMMLVDAELEDDDLAVLFYVWLVEEDGGGVRDAAAALESEFRDRFREQVNQVLALALPRDCVPFIAFYKAALPLHLLIEDAGTKGRNDEVYEPFEIVLERPASPVSIVSPSKDFIMRRSKRLGDYLITMRYRYEHIPVVLG